MKLVAGSYERFLWGWQVKEKKKELQWTFAYPAHIGPIKCIASSGVVVATGGADDTIKVFDINAQKDMGSLYKHEGAVTCLDFHGSHPGINHPTHLLSGSEDGSICIWDTDSWIHLTTMKTKKGPRSGVNDLSIHPSGLLALSVERNNHMKMWNLTKGRCSFQTKLATEASIVKFFPQAGESYAIVMGVNLEIRNAETGTTIHSLHHEKKVFCMAQQEDNLLVTGGEDAIVRAWDCRSGKQAWSVPNAHTNRIKGVAILGASLEEDDSELPPLLVASASSDGTVKVWDMRMVGGEDADTPTPVMQAETKARLTCLVSCSGTKRSGPAVSESVPIEEGATNEEILSSGGAAKQRKKAKKKRKAVSVENDAVEAMDISPSKRQKPKNGAAARGNSKLLDGTRTPKSPGAMSEGTTSSPLKRNREKSQNKDVDTPGKKSEVGTPDSKSDVGKSGKKSDQKKRKLNTSNGVLPKVGKSLDGGKHGKSHKKKRKPQSTPSKTP